MNWQSKISTIFDTNITVTGNILPNTDVTYDLGSATKRWNKIVQ